MIELVLDTETTGLSVKDGHRIVEIGCIELDNLVPTQKKFHEVVDEFLNFIEGKKLIIHNAEFDVAHLNNELKLLGKAEITNEIVDTLVLARNKFPGSQISLDALCKRYRIDNSRRVQHTAIIDCELLAKVYINLIDQKEPTLDFQNQDLKENHLIKKKISYFKKVILPNEAELERHKSYLKKDLKKNYFN